MVRAKGDEEAKLGVLMDVLFAKSPAGAEGEGGVPGMEGGKAVAPDTKDAQTALSRLRAGQSLETDTTETRKRNILELKTVFLSLWNHLDTKLPFGRGSILNSFFKILSVEILIKSETLWEPNTVGGAYQDLGHRS